MRTKDKIYTNLKMEKIQNYEKSIYKNYNLGTIGAIPIFETNTTILPHGQAVRK